MNKVTTGKEKKKKSKSWTGNKRKRKYKSLKDTDMGKLGNNLFLNSKSFPEKCLELADVWMELERKDMFPRKNHNSIWMRKCRRVSLLFMKKNFLE